MHLCRNVAASICDFRSFVLARIRRGERDQEEYILQSRPWLHQMTTQTVPEHLHYKQ